MRSLRHFSSNSQNMLPSPRLFMLCRVCTAPPLHLAKAPPSSRLRLPSICKMHQRKKCCACQEKRRSRIDALLSIAPARQNANAASTHVAKQKHAVGENRPDPVYVIRIMLCERLRRTVMKTDAVARAVLGERDSNLQTCSRLQREPIATHSARKACLRTSRANKTHKRRSTCTSLLISVSRSASRSCRPMVSFHSWTNPRVINPFSFTHRECLKKTKRKEINSANNKYLAEEYLFKCQKM